MKQLRKGFTLIELLVVIAIIGILAAVVLVNVNGARVRARDTAIAAALSSYRTAQEIAYDTGNTYVASTDASVSSIIAQINANNGNTGVRGASNASSYALASQLSSNSALGRCVDSTGANKQITWNNLTTAARTPGNSITVCP